MGFVDLLATASQLLHARAPKAAARCRVVMRSHRAWPVAVRRASQASQSRGNASACRFILWASPGVDEGKIRPLPIARNLSNSATRGVKVSGSQMSELRSDADIEPNSASESMTVRLPLSLPQARYFCAGGITRQDSSVTFASALCRRRRRQTRRFRRSGICFSWRSFSDFGVKNTPIILLSSHRGIAGLPDAPGKKRPIGQASVKQ
jgi:hypothetical protein